MDLYGNGVAHDVVIVKHDEGNGDIAFIKVSDLDNIDKARMRQILTKRNADTMPLWDVMAQVTLKNGVNALSYFHQLVKVKTRSGQIITPSASRRGIFSSAPQHAPPHNPQDNQPLAENKHVEASEPKTRGPGRPPKNKD